MQNAAAVRQLHLLLNDTKPRAEAFEGVMIEGLPYPFLHQLYVNQIGAINGPPEQYRSWGAPTSKLKAGWLIHVTPMPEKPTLLDFYRYPIPIHPIYCKAQTSYAKNMERKYPCLFIA
ncbi:MAG: hypothetical protein CM1200mP40_25170 [Gammaproteobacteria bacterium]|nr:MAG: hypothetical protein CM1200mP40_25170 [Gammaproteobacteria bacterium]